MPTVEKEKMIADFRSALEKAKIAFIAEYQGLTVAEVSKLRRNLKEQDSEMKIIKNTLAKRALKDIGYDDLVDHMTGPLAFILGYETAVQAPKVVVDFAKENEKLKIKSGYYSGKLLDLKVIMDLAELPPMSQLRVKFAMIMSSPPKQLLNTIQSPLKQLVFTLNALHKKQEEAVN